MNAEKDFRVFGKLGSLFQHNCSQLCYAPTAVKVSPSGPRSTRMGAPSFSEYLNQTSEVSQTSEVFR